MKSDFGTWQKWHKDYEPQAVTSFKQTCVYIYIWTDEGLFYLHDMKIPILHQHIFLLAALPKCLRWVTIFQALTKTLHIPLLIVHSIIVCLCFWMDNYVTCCVKPFHSRKTVVLQVLCCLWQGISFGQKKEMSAFTPDSDFTSLAFPSCSMAARHGLCSLTPCQRWTSKGTSKVVDAMTNKRKAGWQM